MSLKEDIKLYSYNVNYACGMSNTIKQEEKIKHIESKYPDLKELFQEYRKELEIELECYHHQNMKWFPILDGARKMQEYIIEEMILKSKEL